MTAKTSDKHTVTTGSSAERSLRLLTQLAQAGRALTLAELAVQLSLPKATTHRLCMQLLDRGMISRAMRGGEFVVGPALRQLALDTLNHDTVRGLRHEELTSLVARVGETCNLTTLDGASVLYLDRVEAPWPWRLTLAVGEHVPLHCTASGKLFLAMMPAEQRELLLSGLRLPRMTDNTLVSVSALRRECLSIAELGYALDREEFIPGLIALAVPVRDAKGGVAAALAVHAPLSRLSQDQAMSKLGLLRAAASRIGKLL